MQPEIVSWSMADHLRAELVRDALTMALAARRPPARSGLLHHSDRGVQYACDEYRSLLAARGITASMSRVGECHDNAPKESCWCTLKSELMYLEHFTTLEQARAAVFECIETFYIRVRLHGSLGHVSLDNSRPASPDIFRVSTVRGQGHFYA